MELFIKVIISSVEILKPLGAGAVEVGLTCQPVIRETFLVKTIITPTGQHDGHVLQFNHKK